MSQKSLCVVKIGSSVLRDISKIEPIVHYITNLQKRYQKILLVASAIGNTTDILEQQVTLLACQADHDSSCETAICEKASNEINYQRQKAEIISYGERLAIEFLKLGFLLHDIPAHITQTCIKTNENYLDATPLELNHTHLEASLNKCNIVLTPGFLGSTNVNDTTLLGRGGSDLSALFYAYQLKADDCILVKDVAGVYNCDPNIFGNNAQRYQSITFEDAKKVNAQLIQDKALHFAEHTHTSFKIESLSDSDGTQVGAIKTKFYNTESFANHAA